LALLAASGQANALPNASPPEHRRLDQCKKQSVFLWCDFWIAPVEGKRKLWGIKSGGVGLQFWSGYKI
jgi:hypothetical protein